MISGRSGLTRIPHAGALCFTISMLVGTAATSCGDNSSAPEGQGGDSSVAAQGAGGASEPSSGGAGGQSQSMAGNQAMANAGAGGGEQSASATAGMGTQGSNPSTGDNSTSSGVAGSASGNNGSGGNGGQTPAGMGNGDTSNNGTASSGASNMATAGQGGTSDGGSPGGGASSGGSGEAGAASQETPSSATWPMINGVQWADTDGNPIQAHGGGMLKVGEDYYWFGENRNPDGTFYAVSAYRSRDLQQWEYVHDVLSMNTDPELKPANIERPKVVYNATTQKYVMWMHWENGKDYGEARAAVASSDTVDGDYTYHGSFRPYHDRGVTDHSKPGYMSRDCTLFVDDDGTGYFLSASNENYDLHLYRLTEDYLSVDERAAVLFEGGHREAPALFKRDGTYFLISSDSTGWDPNQAKYATSSSISSGWSSLKNVGDGTTFHSQSTYVQPIEGSNGTEYLYMGDRWAGAWGGRVNDSTYIWEPISFPSATSISMDWVNNLHIDATAGSVSGTVDAFEFVNKKSGMLLAVDGPADQNSSPLIQDSEASAANFAWRFNYNGQGYFRITNDSGNKVIDVPNESTESGVQLKLYDDNGGDHQAWRLIDLGDGQYRLRNKKSSLYLGVSGASTDAAATIEQQNDGGDEQVWEIRVAQ